MKKKIKLCGNEVEYTLRQSRRARRLRLSIYCDGNLVVTAPQSFDHSVAEDFILQKAQWIIGKIKYFKEQPVKFFVKRGKRDFLRHKETALKLAQERIKYFNGVYGLNVGRVSVKNQKTRWGSCSKAGNLNFNYNIIFLPPRLRDYIIVHELCHLAKFDHSREFWGLVARTIPDHLAARRELKRGGIKKYREI